MNMKTISVLTIAALLVVLGAVYAVAAPGNGFWNSMMGRFGGPGGMMGNGMMGGGMMGSGMMGTGQGMMGSQGGATAACTTMMGYADNVNATPITIEKAKETVEQYLAATGNADLKLSEIMEFNNHFYAEVKEKSTGMHAFELLVNRYTGTLVPEMGPNMMWNTRYSPMAGMVGSSQATVTEKQAVEYAQQYLDRALPGTRADEADAFYGYYTIHVIKDDRIYGMLSVHSNTGAVWYHSWHGAFVKMLEVDS